MAETDVRGVGADTDVDALKAEVERLRHENEELKSSGHERGSSRTAWAIVITVIASLLFAFAVPAVWMNRVVMDTETWVSTVAPLASDPAIQNAVAELASDRIVEALDAQTRLESILPAQLQQLAPLLASSAENFVRTQTTALVRSDQFAQLWTELNRTGHKALIAALTGSRDGAIKYEPGVLTLDVGVLAEQVQAKLVAAGLPFLAKVPVSSIDRQVEIFNSPALAQASVALGAINQVALLLPLAALVCAAAAFALATDRRKVALWLGAGIVIAGALPLQALYLSQFYVTDQLQQAAGLPSSAAQSVYDIVFAQLIYSEQVLILFGLLVFAAAVVAGPAKWAVALRGGLSGGLAGVASHMELGRFGEWVAARKAGLRVAGIIVAVLVLLSLPAPRSMAQIAWLGVLVAVWYLLVELFGAQSAEMPATGVAETDLVQVAEGAAESADGDSDAAPATEAATKDSAADDAV